MGELAATIAHEVNQPLCGILTNGNACLRWLAGVESNSPNLKEALQAVERMIRNGKRAGDVILRLRNFLKASREENTSLKINVQSFYTTKTNGMGLGLSISRSIIKNHGGQLIAQPNNGPGTTFCFTLT